MIPARALAIGRWLLAVGVLAGMVFFFDIGEVFAGLREADWWFAAPAVAGLVLVHVIAALTWRRLAHTLTAMDLPASFAIRAYYAGQSLGGITPGNAGADVYRVHALGRGEEGWKRAIVPVFVQRVTSYVALAALGLVAAFLVPVSETTRLLLLAVPLAVFAALIGGWLVARHGGASVRRWLPGLTATGVRPWRGLADGVALALVFHGIAIALTVALLRALTGGGSVAEVAAAITLARVMTVLPITPNGLGFQETALALLLPEAGVDAELALALAALSRLSMLVTMAIGAVLLARSPGRTSHGPAERASHAAEPAPSRAQL